MRQDEWLDERLAYLRGLKAPSDHQRLLLMLADKPERSAEDARKLAALIRAEKAAERAQKARANAARIINAEKAAQRRARDHELYRSAGLLILAGLVDGSTGKPTRDRGELLGALVSLAEAQVDVEKRAAWKRKGDALLASRQAAVQPQQPPAHA
jgi:CTP:molybdopterin cytidylyltransferase MocA